MKNNMALVKPLDRSTVLLGELANYPGFMRDICLDAVPALPQAMRF
jgi:hypothetical protein